MKRWKVEKWVNQDIRDWWEFEDKEEAIEFYREKIKNLNKERIKENNQATKKFKNDDSWDYLLIDTEYGSQRLHTFKTWRGVKEERRIL